MFKATLIHTSEESKTENCAKYDKLNYLYTTRTLQTSVTISS